jgi:NifU-like protein involved in Fe-S cluster formation
MDEPDAVGRASLGGRAPYVTIFLKVSGDRISKAMFQTFGCGYSIASCSVLTEIVAGLTLGECRVLDANSVIMVLVGIPQEKHFCAQLAIDALTQALAGLPPTSGPAA